MPDPAQTADSIKLVAHNRAIAWGQGPPWSPGPEKSSLPGPPERATLPTDNGGLAHAG